MAVSTIDALYNGTSEKLTTSATGITVTGTVAATAYTGDGSALTGVGSPSIDDNGNATAMTITNDEKIGIGTTNPIGLLSIVDSSTGSGMEFQPEIASNTNRLTNYHRTTSAYKNFRLDGLQLEFQTSGNERLRIDNDGLKFNGDTAAANALDDYEEGTWTPVLSDSSSNNFTMSTQDGLYTKVGNVVTAYFNVQFSNTGSGSGVVRLKGFPFTAKNNSGAYYYSGATINTNGQISVSLAGNGTVAIFHTSTSGAGSVSNFNSAGDNRSNGSVTYLAS